jgi:predicted alpha/beta hydrolase family esterase
VGVAFDIIELMRNALILHGTDADHGSNWLPWLESKLHKLGYTVWVPDLPRADHPDIRRYNEYLLNHSIKWDFIHSDNDPYCPIEDARDLCEQASGKFIELPGQGHFTASLDPKYEAFPELFEIIKKELGQ